jgi:hypothetical protein
MALSKVNFNSINVTPAASKAIKFNSSNNGFETGDVGGSLVLISEQTASGSETSISFTSGLDSTYKEYIFKFIDMHPAEADASELKFQVSADGGSNYGVNITSTSFAASHNEDGGSSNLSYVASTDLAQSTDFNHISQNNIGFDDDQCFAGILHLFEPSSTTFVKHFIIDGNSTRNDNRCFRGLHAGYINSTSAINAIRFAMMDGQTLKNMSGTIKMYGVT